MSVKAEVLELDFNTLKSEMERERKEAHLKREFEKRIARADKNDPEYIRHRLKSLIVEKFQS